MILSGGGEWWGGGYLAQWLPWLLLDPPAPGLIPCIPDMFSVEKIVDVAKVNQRCCLEEIGQWLENVYETSFG